MHPRDNINIENIEPLPSPTEIREKYKTSPAHGDFIAKTREEIEAIISHKSNKFIAIVGPCSIHNPVEAIQYAKKFKKIIG